MNPKLSNALYLSGNRVAAVETGTGYELFGEQCDSEYETCVASSQFTTGSRSSNNFAHSTGHGVRLFSGPACVKLSGFTLNSTQSVGILIVSNFQGVPGA